MLRPCVPVACLLCAFLCGAPRAQIKDLKLPETARLVIDEEVEKLSVLEKNSAEFNVTRSYLDWLTSIPWGVYSKDNLDIGVAKGVLDEVCYVCWLPAVC